MASRRATMGPSVLKSTDTASSRSGNTATKANNSGAGKKCVKTVGTVVKSRYMQAAEKSSLSKSNSLTNESVALPLRPSSPKPGGVRPKVGTPPRRSMAPQARGTHTKPSETERSLLGKSVLQSTFSSGPCFRPEFDISVINEKTVLENAAESERNPEEDKRDIEIQTLQLAYLTAKMESNTAKLKAEAEAKILQVMEEEEALHKVMHEKKRQYLLAEKNRMLHELLDLQIAALTPVAEAARKFTPDYKCFGAAIDATRHELPVKNFYIGGDKIDFLEKAGVCLKESEQLLLSCTEGDPSDNGTSLECLRNIRMTSKDMSQQLSGTFSDLLELNSAVCRHTIHAQQAAEESQLGTTRTLELYCPKQ